jgi:hypothetical protein
MKILFNKANYNIEKVNNISEAITKTEILSKRKYSVKYQEF